MRKIKLLFALLLFSVVAMAQAPSNYTNINGRYRWIAGMFDSTFHIPKGTTPSLRTGGSTNAGGLFYNTSDSSVYTYTGTQWIKLRGVIVDTTSLSNRINLKLNISDTASMLNPYLRKIDTTNKYVTQVYKKNGSDSVFYVKGGVHTWAFNDSTGSAGGGGGGKIYYLNGGVSMGTFGGFTMYELGDTAVIATAANFTRSTTGNIANFITDVGKPGLLQIPAGVWTVDAWLSETGGGSNHAEIYAAVEKWNGSTITTIATSPIEQITEGNSPNLYTWSVSIPTTTLAVTDRIIIQFYIQNTNGKTVTLYTQNGYVGEVHTTFTTGIGAINGLTAPAQYLVTGTSGTDFNISSATATHTFNLPTASATNRGALSTTDWSTFNNKGSVSSVATNTGTGITGGTITTTGTLAIDTLLISTRKWRQKGVDSVAALVSGAVSGTTNYLPKFTGTSTIGNSLVYDDGTRVFINAISAPALGSPKLFVKMATANSYEGLLVASSSNNNVIAIAHTGSQGLITTNYGTSGSNTSLAFGTNGAGQMTLDTSGNLGLGVTPSAWDASTFKSIQIGTSNAIFSGRYDGVLNQVFVGTNYYYDGSIYKYISSSYASRYYQNNSQHIWEIAPSGTAGNSLTFTQAMTLDASGNLGLGTTTPKTVIDANGSIRTTSATIPASGVGLEMRFSTGDDRGEIHAYNRSTSTAKPLYLQFTGGATYFGGNVGIGTTSPTSLLQLSSTSATGTQYYMNSNAGGTSVTYRQTLNETSQQVNMAVESNHPLAFWTASTERMRLTSGGEILINTTSDAGDYKLQVNGAIYTTAGPNYSGGELVFGGTGSGAISGLYSLGTGTPGIYFDHRATSNTGAFYWRNGTGAANTMMSLTNGGNLETAGSIKTAAPSGGTAQPYKWGSVIASSVTIDPDNYVDVEINGVLYKLALAIPSEPEPSPDGYVPYYGPVQSKRLPSAQEKIKDLEKEIAELKELIKSKIK